MGKVHKGRLGGQLGIPLVWLGIILVSLYWLHGHGREKLGPVIQMAADECASFLKRALESLAPKLTSEPVSLCVEQKGKEFPPNLACAFSKGYHAEYNESCKVRYSDVTNLNAYETLRKVEASILSLPSNTVLVRRSKRFSGISSHHLEATLSLKNETVAVAIGEDAIDDSSSCELREERAPREGASMQVWVMMGAGEDTKFVARAREYARVRGYGFLRPKEDCLSRGRYAKLPESWRKISLLKSATKLAETGWVLWLDPFALVTNLDVKIEQLVSGPAGRGALLMVGQDAQPPFLLNVGVLLVRTGRKSAEMLDSVWRCGMMKDWMGPATYYWDQNALTYLAERGMAHAEYEMWLEGIRVLPHRLLSSFMRQGSSVDADLLPGHWKFGDFVALMTGVDKNDAKEQVTNLEIMSPSSQLKWLKSDYRYPTRVWIPPVYSVRLDTYFYTERPTWIVFRQQDPARYSINPSCVWDTRPNKPAGSVWCVVRTINYNLNLEFGFYEWPEVGITINQFFELTPKQYLDSPGETVVVEEQHEMYVPLTITSKMYRTNTEGFEDVKLIRVGNMLYGIATCLQMNPTRNCEIVLLTLEDHKVLSAVPLRGYRDRDCHKNWMPFVMDGALHLVEQVDPLVIIKPEIPQGKAVPLFEDTRTLYNGLRLRGTSNGLAFAEGHLFLIHETVQRGKLYAHRFMYVLGKKGWSRRLTRPFFVVRNTVEFVIGIQMSEDHTKLYLGMGMEDRKPGVVTVHIESPEAFLKHPYLWMD